MIQSFRHKGLEDFFFDGTKRGIQAKHASKLADILDVLDAAVTIQDYQFSRFRFTSIVTKTGKSLVCKSFWQLARDLWF